jgi:hypothetical protein
MEILVSFPDTESGDGVRLLVVVDDVGLPFEIVVPPNDIIRPGKGAIFVCICILGSFSLIRALHMGHFLVEPDPP